MAPSIIIAGGGTGGHLIPNVVMAKLIKQQFKDLDVIQIATNKSIDHLIFDMHEVTHPLFLKTTPFSGLGIFHKLKSLFNTLINVFKCLGLYIKRRPRVVIGVGGYSSVPSVLAAWLLRIPILLQEQNRIPGLANRILANFAKKVLIGFKDSDRYFKSKRLAKKCIYTGNFNLPRLKENLSHDTKRFPPTLFISGGSQGAKVINETFHTFLPALLEAYEALHVIWQCGARWYEHTKAIIDPWPQKDRIKLIDFSPDLFPAYCQSTLCVCRAGALTVADVISSGTPAVFVPFPYAADNHQTLNAQWLVKQQAAILINQNQAEWTSELENCVKTYLTHPEKLNSYQNKLLDIRNTLPPNDVLFSTLRSLIR